jgi:hypothetical protein
MLCNSKFLGEIPAVLKSFPKLQAKEISGKTIICGDIDLISDEGEKLDSYSIEIHPTEDYPGSYPLLFEVSGKIPRNIDWHVYSDGHWCLGVPIEEKIDCSYGINLIDFVKKQVLGFLYSQTFRRRNGYFYRERSHGIIGSFEFYIEYLSLHNVYEVYQALSIATNYAEMKSNAKCFCGSKRKFRKCHRRLLRKLRKIAGITLDDDFRKFNQTISKRDKSVS